MERLVQLPRGGSLDKHIGCQRVHQRSTHWGWNPRPSARGADEVPQHHVSLVEQGTLQKSCHAHTGCLKQSLALWFLPFSLDLRAMCRVSKSQNLVRDPPHRTKNEPIYQTEGHLVGNASAENRARVITMLLSSSRVDFGIAAWRTLGFANTFSDPTSASQAEVETTSEQLNLRHGLNPDPEPDPDERGHPSLENLKLQRAPSSHAVDVTELPNKP